MLSQATMFVRFIYVPPGLTFPSVWKQSQLLYGLLEVIISSVTRCSAKLLFLLNVLLYECERLGG